MDIYYHSDIITKFFGAFLIHSKHPAHAYKVIEQQGATKIDELRKDPSFNEDQFASYATSAIASVMEHNPDFGSMTGLCARPYQPEHMKDINAKSLILSMCAHGRFIPFIIELTEYDVSDNGKDDVLIMTAGIGDYPYKNFIVVTINIQGMLHSMKIDVKETGIKHHMIYPVIYDAYVNAAIPVLPKEFIAVKPYILEPYKIGMIP